MNSYMLFKNLSVFFPKALGMFYVIESTYEEVK